MTSERPAPDLRVPSFSDYIVFVDESGDHGLESVDPTYPIFVLALCLFEKEAYAGVAAPGVLRFKFRHFGHDQVILHEHEIRKTKGPFQFLFDAARREPFYNDLNELITASPFTLVASVIDKQRHLRRYSQPNNPYSISVGFGLERVFMHLKGLGCEGGTTHFLFEKRGPKEDADIETVFRRACEGANFTGQRLPFEIVMADKKCNSAGLQIADLVARPVGRKMLNPGQPNRAYDLILPKFRRSPVGRVDGWGLKIFP